MKREKTLWGMAGLAALISALLVLVCYVYWNMPYTFGYGDDQIAFIAKYKDLVSPQDRDYDVVVVNVSYDKVLVPQYKDVMSDSGKKIGRMRVGETEIVDRKEMASLMKYLKETDNYKYILCDVAFDGRYETEYDEELYSTLASMRDIVVVAADSVPDQLASVVVSAGYRIKKTGDDFLKYNCLIDGCENVALKMWKDITGGEYEEKLWGISMNGRRCLNSFIPDFRFILYDDLDENQENNTLENGQEYETVVENLGTGLVDAIQYGGGLEMTFKDKIVLIGSWYDDDMHDTIVGEQPGISIIYNAYLALVNRDNHVPFMIYLMLFLLFWVEAIFLLRKVYREELLAFSKSRQDHRLSRFINGMLSGIQYSNRVVELICKAVMYFFSYTTPIAIFVLVVLVTKGLFVNVFLIGLCFAFLDSLIGEVFVQDTQKDENKS